MEKLKNSNLGWAEVVYDDFHLSGREYVLFVQISVSHQFIVKCGYAVQPAPESPQGAVIGHCRVVEVCQFRLCVRSDSKVFIHSFHSVKFIIYSLKLLISNRLCKYFRKIIECFGRKFLYKDGTKNDYSGLCITNANSIEGVQFAR